MGARLDVPAGQRFGRLTVVREGPGRVVPGKPWRRRSMICRCACGSQDVEVLLELLVKGITRSCGCLRRETAAARQRRLDDVPDKPTRAAMEKRIIHLEEEVHRLHEELYAAHQELGVLRGYSR